MVPFLQADETRVHAVLIFGVACGMRALLYASP
jgi:hypothetical protein